MRHVSIIASLLGAILCVGFANAKPLILEKYGTKNQYVPNQLLVRVKNPSYSSQLRFLHKAFGARVVQKYDIAPGLELVSLPHALPVEKAIEYYKKNRWVAYAEPNYIVHAFDDAQGGDPSFSKQWPLGNTGQTDGIADVDLNMTEAWKLTKGDKNVVIAIIDTGVLYTHPDLKDNVWINPGEVPGNGIDDDNNGYVDDIHGINAITKSGGPLDDNGHGTHCSGIMAGVGENGVGISGVMQKASIIGCKFLDASGSGTTGDAVACVDYLAALAKRQQNPVHIVASNNSWGGGGFSQALYDSIRAHEELGILFMAAASNDARDNDLVETYPADYQLANIISVAASDSKDSLGYFSNYGRYSVTVSAPGVDIYSTFLNNAYDTLSGTSMATPHVTGLAGLIRSRYVDADWRAIKNLVIAGGQPVGDMAAKTISGRRIKAFGSDGTGALTCANQQVQSRLFPLKSSLTMSVGESLELSALAINCERASDGYAVILNDGQGSSNLESADNGQGKDRAQGDGVFTHSWNPQKAGRYELIFNGNDKVVATVINPGAWKAYQASEAPYTYRNIGGTALNGGDDSNHVIASSFPILFAGDDVGFSTLFVNSNGAISLTDSQGVNYRNEQLPLSSLLTLIVPYRDDLDAARSGEIFYETIGSAPNRELVVEWRDVAHFDAGKTVTFQVVFFEGKSDILFNYKNTDVEKPAFSFGASATIGVQTGKQAATAFSFNEAKLKNEFALLFKVIDAQQSGSVVDSSEKIASMASFNKAMQASDPMRGLGGCRAVGAGESGVIMALAYIGVLLLRRRKQ